MRKTEKTHVVFPTHLVEVKMQDIYFFQKHKQI